MAWLLQPTLINPPTQRYKPHSTITLSWRHKLTTESSYKAAYGKKPPLSLPSLRYSNHFVLSDEDLRKQIQAYDRKWPTYAIPFVLPVCPDFILNNKAHQLPDAVVIKDKIVSHMKPSISMFKVDYGPESVGDAHPPKYAMPARRPPRCFYEEY